MKQKIISLLAMATVLILSSCSLLEQRNRHNEVSVTKACFGTIMTITLYGEEQKTRALIEECFDRLNELEAIFSARKEDSELERLNKNAYNKDICVSDELFYVISMALDYNKKTDGALDVSIGKLVSLWGIGTEDEGIPEENEIKRYAGMDGCKSIILDKEKKSVRFTDSRIKLDLGAVAKGYAADEIKELIISHDEKACGILNFGGNIMTIGSRPDGVDFNIGIADPKQPDKLFGTVKLRGESLVTSGDYERFFVEDGVTYHHILDAKTGYPAGSGLSAVSIVGKSSADCDALSTACFVLGKDKGMELINSLPDYEALFIDTSGQCFMTEGFMDYEFMKTDK